MLAAKKDFVKINLGDGKRFLHKGRENPLTPEKSLKNPSPVLRSKSARLCRRGSELK